MPSYFSASQRRKAAIAWGLKSSMSPIFSASSAHFRISDIDCVSSGSLPTFQMARAGWSL